MSNFFGIIKKQQDYVLPSIQTLLKDNYCLEDCIFCFEESFDISIFENEQLLIMVSGFISNITELCAEKTSPTISPAEVIAKIYQLQPENFHQKLLGNFAISIFNKSTKNLILVRDHFGARPLYLIDQGLFFAFSTDMSLLINADIVPLHFNKNTMVDYLSLRIRDGRNTFYSEIERLEASNFLTLKEASTQTHHYDYVPTHNSHPNKSVLKEFAFKFENAIRHSHFSNKNVGLMLSGGLDSSAIAIGMKNLGVKNVETFSGNYTHLPEKQRVLSDETKFQTAVSSTTGYNHNPLPLENISPLASIEKYLSCFSEPIHMPNIYLFEEVALAAKRKHIDMIFDGQDGDNVISHGNERFPELLKSLNVIGFLYEIYRYSAFNQVKLKNTIRFFASHILLKWGLRKVPKKNDSIVQDSIFFDKRFFWQPTVTAVDPHQDKLTSPLHAFAWEWRYLFFKHFGIEVRSPFYNKELITFC
nr:asparagine synthase-related protein [Candidatus Neomarinimicrobiota bacterium]